MFFAYNVSIDILMHYIFANVHYFIILLGILIIYFLIKSMIIWFLRFRAIRLLSFVVSSLVVFVITLTMIVFGEQFNVSIIKLFLQGLSFFGIGLLMYYLFSYIKNTLKKA